MYSSSKVTSFHLKKKSPHSASFMDTCFIFLIISVEIDRVFNNQTNNLKTNSYPKSYYDVENQSLITLKCKENQKKQSCKDQMQGFRVVSVRK